MSEVESYKWFVQFLGVVADHIESARKFVGTTADLPVTTSYYIIGQMIVDREQEGKERAEYVTGLMKRDSPFI
ncbi:MAG: hypothetical protein LBF12_01830 [Christensenellaceae bacterium]|jgi:hypothetical protein|nr:hypothetical protein [Christensenellaceae bacterium]